MVPEEILKELKVLVKNNGIVEYSYENLKLDLNKIGMLKAFALAKVEYNKKEKKIKFFIPREYIEVIEKCLRNKKLLEENKRNNEILVYIMALLEAYGIIEFENLYEMIEKEFKISFHDLEKIIDGKSMIDDCLCVHMYDYQKLVCNLEFVSEDEAFDFYEQSEGEYKKFTQNEIEKLKNDSYVVDLKSYKKLINHLQNHFEDFKESEMIKLLIIMDYISTAQIDELEAEEHFMHNIEDFFEVEENEKREILELVKEVFQEYPKWRKRGNV